mgnify:CR=1 FL=1
MKNFDDILNSSSGQIMISIIWGLGLAALFRKACVGRNCIVIKGPDPNTIQKKIFKYAGKCYKFTPYTTQCGKKNVESFTPYSRKI